MKKLFVILLLVAFTLASPADAQTPVPDKTAATYYQNCLKKRDERMTEMTQKIFCECTQWRVQEAMTMEDLQAMTAQNPGARSAMNKMIIEVYAPCMEFPVRDLIYQRCRSNKFRVQSGICDCLAKNMALYTAEIAQERLRTVLKEQPAIADPMSPIVNSPAFARKEKEIALQCVQEGM